MGLGRLDHLAFCGPSNGNCPLARPASSSMLSKACADAAICFVTSAWAPADAGIAPRWAIAVAVTMTKRPADAADAIRSGEGMRNPIAHLCRADGTAVKSLALHQASRKSFFTCLMRAS